jgi:hypothetical protein
MPEPARYIGGALLLGIIYAAAVPVFAAVFTGALPTKFSRQPLRKH